jgi:hypothetical protein
VPTSIGTCPKVYVVVAMTALITCRWRWALNDFTAHVASGAREVEHERRLGRVQQLGLRELVVPLGLLLGLYPIVAFEMQLLKALGNAV